MSEGKLLVGVDIGASSIKVCEFSEDRKGAKTLIRFGYHPLPAQAVVDGHVINSGVVVEGLEKIFHKAKNRNVAVRVSGHSVIIKKITMPIMTPQELEAQISWEAEQHLPFDLAEVELDWEVLATRPHLGQMDVLLVAAKREEVNDIIGLVAAAKLKTRVVDLDAFAMQNAYEKAYGFPNMGENIVLVNVGASITTLNVLNTGQTLFTRDVPAGGIQITDEIQRHMGLSFDEAELYKCGGDGKGMVPKEVSDLVNSGVENLVGEIQRSLDFFLATSGEKDLSRIVVSGGVANVHAFLESLQGRMRTRVERFDPLRIAAVDGSKVDVALLQSKVSQLPVAFGLGLRRQKEIRG